jgi:plasmid segregation protein ParM
MAHALRENRFGGYTGDRRIFLQTGLPPAFRTADTPLLKESLSGTHKFEVSFGGGDFRKFDFGLLPENIGVIDQPMGSVFSASLSPDLSQVFMSGDRKFAGSRVIVFDAGFGTTDVFDISDRKIKSSETWTGLGMREVFARISNELLSEYGKEIRVHALQRALAKGKVTVYDRKGKSSYELDITDIVNRASEAVCEEALTKLDNTFSGLSGHEALIVTGGAGAAWRDKISERYKNMESLIVTSAAKNDSLHDVYSNARGYYLYRVLACRQTGGGDVT